MASHYQKSNDFRPLHAYSPDVMTYTFGSICGQVVLQHASCKPRAGVQLVVLVKACDSIHNITQARMQVTRQPQASLHQDRKARQVQTNQTPVTHLCCMAQHLALPPSMRSSQIERCDPAQSGCVAAAPAATTAAAHRQQWWAQEHLVIDTSDRQRLGSRCDRGMQPSPRKQYTAAP